MAESGVYIAEFLKPYLAESTIHAIPGKVIRNKNRFEKLLTPVEPWIMTVQSLLVWENWYKSAILMSVANIGFWIVSCYYHRMIAVIAWSVLMVYLVYIWKTIVWPVIRVPSPLTDQDDWIPVHANLMSVPELSQYLAESFVTIRLYGRALRNLRAKRKSAFLVLIWLMSVLMMIMGQMISGFTLSYILVMMILVWPCAVYHKIFPRIYLHLEPHLMKLQYSLKQQLVRAQRHKQIKDNRGDTAETDSDDELSGPSRPVTDAALHEAIARSITDSEDEASPTSPASADLALSHLDVDREDTMPLESLAPDVSQMPDFEQICEDSHTFMLDTDVMPSIDDVDHSQFMPQHYQAHNSHDDTGSETESIPFDEELNSGRPTPPASEHQTSSGKVAELSEQAMSLATSMMGNLLTSTMATGTSLMEGLGQRMAGNRDSLMLDPRDRIGDASIEEADDELADYEILSKDELNFENQ